MIPSGFVALLSGWYVVEIGRQPYGVYGLLRTSEAVSPNIVAAAVMTSLVVYACGTVVWIFVLKSVPLTLAYSFMALTFCFVPILAMLFLGETLSLRFAAGMALIMAGMLVVNL